MLAFLAAFDVGERVALANPGYPAYRNTLQALGLEPVLLPTTAETRFQPTVAMLEALEKPIQGLIVASPSNPTGTMLPRRTLEAVAAFCDGRGIRVVSDEIYHGITYGEPGGQRRRLLRKRSRDQRLLKIFRDDRLAARLDGCAR